MWQKNNNKLLENSCLLLAGVGGLIGFLYQKVLSVAVPMVAVSIYLSRVQREKTQDYIEKLQNEIEHLEGKLNEHLEDFEDSLQSLPNNMINYYTQRLTPLISQLQSQQKISQEKLSKLEKDFQENWQFINDLGVQIEEIEEKFQKRSEIKELKNMKEVISNIYHNFRKYVTDTTFQEELITLTQSLSSMKGQVDKITKEIETQAMINNNVITESDLVFYDFVKNDELKKITENLQQDLTKYITNQEFRDYHEQVCSLVAKNNNSVNKKIMEEIESDIAQLQISINNFVTIDTLSEIMDDFLSKDDIEDLKSQVNQLSEKLNQNENLTVLTKIRTILDRLVKQEDLEYLQEQFQLLQYKFNHRPELNTMEKIKLKLAEINLNILPLEKENQFLQELPMKGEIQVMKGNESKGEINNFFDHQDINNENLDDQIFQNMGNLDLGNEENLESLIVPSSEEDGTINFQGVNNLILPNIQSQITFLNNQVQHILELQSNQTNIRSGNPLISDDYNLINEHLQDLQAQITVLNEGIKHIPSEEKIEYFTTLLTQVEFLNQTNNLEENSPTLELNQFNEEYVEILKNLIILMETSMDFFVTSKDLETLETKIEDLKEKVTEKIDMLPSLEHITDLIIALKVMVTKEELNTVKKEINLQFNDYVKWQDLELAQNKLIKFSSMEN